MSFPGRLPVIVLSMALAAGGARAAVRVGDEVSFRAESPHPYAAAPDGGPAWSVRIFHPGAAYLAVHFARLELAPGDRIVVRSGDGRQRHTFTGRGKGGRGRFWATHVRGDRARVEIFRSAPGSGGWGAAIDRYAAGRPGVEAGPGGTEAICGADDKRNAACYESTEPPIHDQVRAVARLLIHGVNRCTGFLVGCQGHLLTNQHCIGSEEDALNTDYEFLAAAPACEDANCPGCFPGTFWAGTPTLVKENVTLDYALILLDGSPQDSFGALQWEDRPAAAGERIYIPQHPGGRALEIALESTDPADPDGVCRVSTVDAFPCQPAQGETVANVGYFCDTETGSSGSPVLAYSSRRLIALHHCALCPNRAVPFAEVLDDLGPLLPACAPPEVSPAGATVPFRMDVDGAGSFEFELASGADPAYHLYQAGTLADALAGDWAYKFCDLENSELGIWSTEGATARWTPASPTLVLEGFWVVVAANRTHGVEGSYGVDSDGNWRLPDLDGSGSVFDLGCPAP